MAKARPTDGAVTKETATEQGAGEGTCFVLMPFTVKGVDVSRYPDPDHWRNVYEGLIAPAIHGAELRPDRDDKDVGTRVIIEEILRKIEDADMVLCDLSSHNPNVFLEMGWALRADKPYVLIHDDLTDFTFDLNQTPTHRYGSALQPLQLREDIPSLTEAIRATRADEERRYSLVTRMAINLQAIEAARGGDNVQQLLLQLLDRVGALQGSVALRRTDQADYPWPRLLHRATEELQTVKDTVAGCGQQVDHNTALMAVRTAASLDGAYGSEEIQVSLIDADRKFVLHDRSEMVGRRANYPGLDGSDMYDDVFAYPEGAVAWTDRAANLARLTDPNRTRHNIALFSTLPPTDLKVVVEVHHRP